MSSCLDQYFTKCGPRTHGFIHVDLQITYGILCIFVTNTRQLFLHDSVHRLM